MLGPAILKTVFILGLVVGVFAPLVTWVERKQSALMQDRIGANRASIGGIRAIGLFHPLADVLKLLSKEDVVPEGAIRWMHLLAPVVASVPAIVAYAVIPFGGVYEFGASSLEGASRISLVVSQADWGVLFVFAVGSLGTYGVVMAGWASNNNWSFLGAVRATAQMISYEVAMGLSLVGAIMVFGTLGLQEMALAQDRVVWVGGFLPLPAWGIVFQPLGFVLFLTAIMAENKRPPFDLPEAESELVAGYFTEYSGMRFGLFYMAEFIEVVVIAGLVATVFLGGWALPYLSTEQVVTAIEPFFGRGVGNLLCIALHVSAFLAKVVVMIWFQMLIRWSVPRFRYDQLMSLCWKGLLPLSLANIFATAAAMFVLGAVE